MCENLFCYVYWVSKKYNKWLIKLISSLNNQIKLGYYSEKSLTTNFY